MHTFGEEGTRNQYKFYDAANNYLYSDLVMREGELIKARNVIDTRTNIKIGYFVSKQIIRTNASNQQSANRR